jgi:nucleoside-diphosphate-sugar epimerase
MRVVVTGANGFLGSHLVERSLAAGDEVTAVVRPSANLRWLTDARAAQMAAVTLEDGPRLAEVVAGSDVVYHLAGATRARPEARFHEINAGGTEALLRACAAARPRPSRLVLCSTLAAARPAGPDRPIGAGEAGPAVSVYGQSKRDAERAALDPRWGLEVVVLRPGAIYGPRDVDLLQVLRLAARGLHVRIGAEPVRYHFIHAHDAADAFLAAGRSPAAVGQVLPLGHGESHAAGAVEEILAAAVGQPIRLRLRLPALAVRLAALGSEVATWRQPLPPTLNRDKARILTAGGWTIDMTRTIAALGFRPAVDLETGLRDTVAWYRREGWL